MSHFGQLALKPVRIDTGLDLSNSFMFSSLALHLLCFRSETFTFRCLASKLLNLHDRSPLLVLLHDSSGLLASYFVLLLRVAPILGARRDPRHVALVKQFMAVLGTLRRRSRNCGNSFTIEERLKLSTSMRLVLLGLGQSSFGDLNVVP
jgi:hypothetical protein